MKTTELRAILSKLHTEVTLAVFVLSRRTEIGAHLVSVITQTQLTLSAAFLVSPEEIELGGLESALVNELSWIENLKEREFDESHLRIVTTRLSEVGNILRDIWHILDSLSLLRQLNPDEIAAKVLRESSSPALLTQARDSLKEIKSSTRSAEATSELLQMLVDDTRTRAEEFREELKEILGIASNLTHKKAASVLADEFSTQANEQTRLAKWWTRVTAVMASLIILVIGLSVWYFGAASTEVLTSADFQILAGKALLTLTLGFIARWASKRASHHLAQESVYRRLSLNLGISDAYVKSISTEKRDDVIAHIAKTVFTEVPGKDPAADFETLNVQDLAKQLITPSSK